jgi:phospholipid/cholesterol/gamma-HCH transport system substrate-binding protein
VARATPALPQLARNVEASTENLPAVLVQAQETARQLEALSERLSRSWLLGGGGGAAPTSATPPQAAGAGRGPVRPAPERVRP